jgi:hypothetical protein
MAAVNDAYAIRYKIRLLVDIISHKCFVQVAFLSEVVKNVIHSLVVLKFL